MDTSLACLDLTEIFCDVDDFYQVLERVGESTPGLPYDGEAKHYRSRLSISEVMTIVIAFHGSGFRTFKDFYTASTAPLERRFPGVGELQPFRRTHALEPVWVGVLPKLLLHG
jgi:hypothetical protein